MSRWEEEFENNPLHATLKGVRDFLNVEVNDIDNVRELEKRRLTKVLDLLDEALASLDKETAPLPLLNQINGHFRHQNFWAQLKLYSEGLALSGLIQANNHINSQIPTIYQLKSFSRNSRAAEPAHSLEKSYDRLAETIQSKSEEFATDVEEQRTKLNDTINRHQTLSEDVVQLIERTGSQLSTWQTEFTEFQITHAKKFSDQQIQRSEDQQTWFNSFKSDANAKSDTYFSELKYMIEEIKSDVTTRHKSMIHLHGLIAGDSVAEGYAKNAGSEKQAADVWRWISIGFIAATVTWIGIAIYFPANSGNNGEQIWIQTLKAISLTGVLLFGSVYASKQSSIHRSNERQIRWFALEVKAIDPFIASLEPAQQNALKEKLSERLFGQNNHHEGNASSDVDPNILKVIFGFMKDLKSLK